MGFRELFRKTSTEEVDPIEAQRRYFEGSALIDVREPDEYYAGHAPGADPIPLGQLAYRMNELSQSQEVLFVCRSGSRSGIASELAARAGIKAVNVRGGMLAWVQDGLPVES